MPGFAREPPSSVMIDATCERPKGLEASQPLAGELAQPRWVIWYEKRTIQDLPGKKGHR
jgi:hypothetical protein